MNEISQGAQALSTYGLYTIVAVLAIIVVYLYKRVSDLEKELRNTIVSNSSEITKNAVETARLLEQTNDALKDNTAAFNNFQHTLSDLKGALGVAMERMK